MTKNEAACCKKCLGGRTKNGYLVGYDPKCSHDWQIYETADKTGDSKGQLTKKKLREEYIKN